MTAVMKGVRILEVAEHTFVPAASALLSDWGAEVIKIEHVERGDAMRGLASSGTAPIPGNAHALLEHANRGKKSIGLDLKTSEGLDILYRLSQECDVFLTNKLPSVRASLKIELDDIRSHNPHIIYVSGTGQGEFGPDADKGSYDSLAFWCRTGTALGATRSEYGHVVAPPGPAYGDSIGAMTIAGGIMGALFHRLNTGEATTVEVSLLGAGMWAMGSAIALSLALGLPWGPSPTETPRANPLVANYLTSDGRWVALTCLQAGKYWPPLCAVIGRPELATDPRFSDHASLMQNSTAAADALRIAFAERSLSDWRRALESFVGQWAVVQDTLEAAADPQSKANGYIQECETSSGEPFRLVAAPVQFGRTSAQPARAPDFNEHGDQILTDLGLDSDTVIELKIRGIVA